MTDTIAAGEQARTFLFTDVEGSTKLWEERPDEMRVALEAHDEILRAAIARAGGVVFSTAGDAFAAAFGTADDAVDAAVDAQRGLEQQPWPDGAAIRVRMGVHTGPAHQRDDNFFGPTLNRAARLMSAAHGGQTVVSSATRPLVGDVPLEDLGQHRLKDLSEPEHVWQLMVDGLRTEFPPLRTLDEAPTNLPVAVSSFIGRRRDIETSMAALENSRLVTLTGVGGVGKTRLSLQVAADASHHYPQGLWFVELAPVRIGDAVPYRFLETLGLDAEPGRPPLHTVAGSIGAGSVLMIVDNCEHVIDEAADAVDELLRLCPNLRVLATSRRTLRLHGEQVVPVPPLAVTENSGPGLELFLDRAEEASGGVDFADRADVVARICEQLDGVPLAIELAAARTRSMTPEDLAARLDERLGLLKASGRRDEEDRHGALLSTIQWSYDLLDDDQRRLFDRLAVFAGTFTLEAAEQVCANGSLTEGDVIDLLDDLVDHSLLVSDTSGDRARFGMLETIREFAARQLGDEAGALRDRHVAWHERWVERIGTAVMTVGEGAAVAELEAGWSDLRAAVDHAGDDVAVLAGLLGPLAFEAQSRGRLEFGEWADGALARADGEAARPGVVAPLLAGVATMSGVNGQLERAGITGDRLAELVESGEAALPITELAAAVSGVMMTGNVVVAQRLQRLMPAAAADEPWAPSLAATWAAFVATYAREPERARESVAAAVAAAPVDLGPTLRASIHWLEARNSEAPPTERLAVLELGIDLAESVDSKMVLDTSNQLASHLRVLTGDVLGPVVDSADRLRTILDAGTFGQVPHAIAGASLILQEVGRLVEPVTLLGWMQTQETFRNQLPELPEEHRELAQPFLDAGAAMSVEEVVRFAIDELLKVAEEVA